MIPTRIRRACRETWRRPPTTEEETVRPRGRSSARILTATILVILLGTPGVLAQGTWTFDEPVRVSEGIKDPVDFAFGRDGYVYFASLTPTEIRRVDLETGDLDEAFVVTLEDAYWEPGTETGIFGLALHPDFASNGILFASYSKNESGEWTNVLSRVTLEDATGAATEEVLMTRPGGIFHNGGRILIVDEHLWWTTGDTSNPFMEDPKEAGKVSQQDGDMRGKVLRLNLDGTPAEGNAWGDAAYTKGHRNVYGIAWDPENERMMVTENGNAKRDYAYILEPGGNYGWPECEGACDEPRPEYIDPIWQSEGGTVAPTGIAWFRGAFWFGTFNQGDIMRISDHNGDWEIEKIHHYPGTDQYPPRVLDVEVGPDGQSLWFSAWSELWRIDFGEDPDHPAVSAIASGPFWWNGTATGEQAEPEPDEEPEGEGAIPGPSWLVLLAVVAGAALVRHRNGARR